MSAGIGFTGGAISFAQPAPKASFNQSLIPPDVPTSVLIGDTFKFKVRFKNTATTGNSANIGYAPFIDLAVNFRGSASNSSGVSVTASTLTLPASTLGASNQSGPNANPVTTESFPIIPEIGDFSTSCAPGSTL
jgi:hypothetical protein